MNDPFVSGPLAIARELAKASRLVSIRIVTAGTTVAVAASFIPLALLDYTFRFGRGMRCLLAAILVAAGFVAWRKLTRKFRPLAHETDAASFVERIRKNLKSLFLTGVEAEAGRTRGDHGLTGHVVQAATAAIGPEALDHIDRVPLARIGKAAIVILATALIFLLLDPDAASRHSIRLLLPAAAIDPATATRIRVEPGDAVITRGDSILLRATMTGVLPPDATLLLTDETGAVTRLPMDVARSDSTTRVFEILLPRVDASFRYEMTAGDARTYPFELECRIPPGLVALTVRLHAPPYTGRAVEELVDPGSLRILRGTRIELSLTADRPLAAALVILETESSIVIPMVTDGTGATVSLAPEESCTLDIRLEGEDGASARAHRDLRLEILEDHPPAIEILSPRRTVKAVATEEIAFVLAASDDIGLAGIRVHVAIADETEIVWKSLDRRGETAVASFVLPLEEFSLAIGDAVHVRIEATDVAGGSSSRERMIQIQPYERYYRYRAGGFRGLEALMPAIRKFIALEQGVISRTTESLGAGRDAMKGSAEHQERVRTELAAELQKLREIMKTDDPLDQNRVVVDQVLMDAQKAEDEMAHARDRLHDGRGNEGLGAERAALNHLMKAYQSILAYVTNASSPQTERMERELEEQFENLPRDTAPRQAQSGQEQNSRSAQESQSLLDRAREMMKNGQATAEELKNMARDIDQMAQGLEGQGSSGSNRDADTSAGAGDPNRSGEQENGGSESGPGSSRDQARSADAGSRGANGDANRDASADRDAGANRDAGSNRDASTTASGGSSRSQGRPDQQGQQNQQGGSEAQSSQAGRSGDPSSQDGRNPQAGRSDAQAPRDGRTGSSGALQPGQSAAGMSNAANAPNRRLDQAHADRLRAIAQQMRQMAAQNAGGTSGRSGSGALVDLLGQLIDLLETVRDTTSARDTIADLLDRIENDPDSVPPEMREIIRRYFELLR